MSNRREFLKGVAGGSAGAFLLGSSGLMRAAYARPQAAGGASRRQVTIGGRRVKTVDVHTHIFVPEALDIVKGTSIEQAARGTARRARGRAAGDVNLNPLGPARLKKMDDTGIDVHALSVNPFWFSADRNLASRLIDLQNEKLAAMCKAQPDRFVALATVALQFPTLAAQQLEEGMKRWGLRGAAIGGNVEGEELSSPKFDPFWAKAEELQALIFVHPQNSAAATGTANRLQGNGFLGNIIGNPLETSIFLTHMIFEGTLDKFPNLKLCLAHGGGYLPAYPDRMDQGCMIAPQRCQVALKKRPSEYLKQIYVDSMVFSTEGLRHLAAVCGPGQIVIGTDDPVGWVPDSPVDPILATPGLSDADKTAMVGGTARKLLNIPA